MAPAQKQAFFHQLLQRDFDVPGIARFVLGPYWRVASEPEKQEFSSLFEDYIVRVYSERFAQYRGEALRLTGSRSDPEGAIVTSEIVRPPGAPPIKVDWRLSTRDGLYKISDVIIDGVSMQVSERSQFASGIQRSGGQVQSLLAMMREKAAAPTSAADAALPPLPR
jgi:phospholipid transport system substrate-binding protein